MTGQTLELNSDDFDQTVRGSDRPVLVDFHAGWCAPCLALGPTIDALADDYAGRATIAKVDVDSNPALAERLEVTSIPTVLVFVAGEATQRFVGIHPKETLARALDEAVGRSAA